MAVFDVKILNTLIYLIILAGIYGKPDLYRLKFLGGSHGSCLLLMRGANDPLPQLPELDRQGKRS
jgi:hypothetical protein